MAANGKLEPAITSMSFLTIREALPQRALRARSCRGYKPRSLDA